MHNPDTIFNYTIQMVRITKYQRAIWHIDALIATTTNNINRMGMGVEGDTLEAHSFQ